MLRKVSNASLAANISGAIVSPSVAVATTPVIVTYTTVDPHNLYVGARVTITGLSSSDANSPNVTRQLVYRLDGPNSFSVILPTTTAYANKPTITLTGGAGVYGTMISVNSALSASKVQYSEPVLVDRPTFYNYIYPTITATPTGTGISLDWTAIGVAFPSVITYRLERVTGTNSSVILSSNAQGTYLDENIATVGSAATFNYRVSAANTKAINSATTSAVSLYVSNISTITAVPVAGVQNAVTISWTAPTTNAVLTSYELQRLDITTTSPVPSWSSLVPESGPIPPSQTTYTDLTAVDGINYTYRVRAAADYETGGNVYSNYTTSSSVTSYYMNNPASITATAAAGIANRINVSWSSVTANPATVTYELQEAVSATGATYGAWTTVQSTTATSFARTSAVSAYYYKYRVRAINAQITGDYVEIASAVQAYYLADPVLAPTVAKAASTNSAIVVSGTNNAIPSISGYNIRRSADAGANWSNIGATDYSITLPYTDSTTATNTAYVYSVKAQNAQLTTANWSNNSASIISNSPPLAPTGLTAVSGTTGSDINLSWTASSVPSTSPATVTYTLERSLTGTNGWSVVSSAISGTTYNDTGRSLSVTYYYRVLGSNTVGSSGYSNTANATITLIPGSASIAITPSAGSAYFNTNLSIAASTNANRSVTLQSSTDGTTWSAVATQAANASGSTTFNRTITTNTGTVNYFRAVVAQDAIYTQTTSASQNETTIANYLYASTSLSGGNVNVNVTDVTGTNVSGATVAYYYRQYGFTTANFTGYATGWANETTNASGNTARTYGSPGASQAYAVIVSKANYNSYDGRYDVGTAVYVQEATGYVAQNDYRSHAEQNGWNGRIGGDGGYMYSGWWSTAQGRQAGSAYWTTGLGGSHPWAKINRAISIDGVFINITRQGGTGGSAMNISYGVHNSASAVTDFDNLGKATNLLWGATNVPAYSASNNREYGVSISGLKDYFRDAVWSTGAKGLTFGHQTEATTQGNYAVINNNVELYLQYVANPYLA